MPAPRALPIVVLVLALLALLPAACNGDTPGPDEEVSPASAPNGVVEIDVIGGDIFYQPNGVEIPTGSPLVVHFANEGASAHVFATEDDPGTGMVDPGETETVELGPFQASTVAFCTVPGHREAGMEFDITVTD
jgi:nitrite reductase (NO-forming)